MHANVTQAIALCKQGFDNHDRSLYTKVIVLLKQVSPQTPAIEKALRLCDAGQSMISPRFAYPHIIDALKDEF